MFINQEKAKTLWRERYGDRNEIRDYVGRLIRFNEYGTNSPYAWDIDHLFPESKGGTDRKENLLICHVLTNDNKADKTAWKEKYNDGKYRYFQIKKKKGSSMYQIWRINTGDEDVLVYDPTKFNN
ncbi:HNH endonuclease domain-containing protein [Mycoplasma simbae]|uniref:HNH endonuclease domain-containing protein n=1 Tax=Mycoplasma simbae TaxID=36744 RepID=UPI00068ED320|nr:HNH endonuclease domain-containing protein [Mycoplasma simbae]